MSATRTSLSPLPPAQRRGVDPQAAGQFVLTQTLTPTISGDFPSQASRLAGFGIEAEEFDDFGDKPNGWT